MKYVFIGLIKFYKKCISPLFPPCCRYQPTCSSYGIEAFRKHGFFKGFILTAWRILRCNPWSEGGIDNVPDEFHIFGRKNKQN
ncbi:MAG: membrane protein insertion efficiency factor YidD [Porcipelethomonas sp.]